MIRWIIGFVVVLGLFFLYTRQTITREYLNLQIKEIAQSEDIIKEIDLDSLPKPVQNYLKYVGVVGKNKVSQFKLIINGEMKQDKNKEWAPVHGEQHTYLHEMTRLFYLKMKYQGIPIYGLHHFDKEDARMKIKLLNMIKVVDLKGEIMRKAETVTYFNDICVFAPSALIDADIEWTEIGDDQVRAKYTLNGITVSADLYFDDKGRLVNFISNDRYALESQDKYVQIPWSTPLYEYKNFDGYNLASKGEAIWHYDDGDFSYIKLNIIKVSY